jgi:Na+/proline symporter
MDPNVFPVYLRGFMLAAFAAAYMSTIGTQLNWGASYVINDFYRRFIVRDKKDRHYVLASQVTTVVLMMISIIVTMNLKSIEDAWKILLVTGAGTGLVLLLRWFWWRINAWSEVFAMAAAAVVSIFLQTVLKWDSGNPKQFAYLMLVTVGITTVIWLTATFVTSPEPMDKLLRFYRQVRPEGPGWERVRIEAGLPKVKSSGGLAAQFANWFLGCVLIYAYLFGIGYIIFGEILKGLLWLAAGVIATALILRNLQRTGWASPASETASASAVAEPGSAD